MYSSIQTWRNHIGYVLGIFILVLVPYLHIGVVNMLLWVPDKEPVDREKCGCNCWDTIFKGSYQGQSAIGYKHIYFNATPQAMKIWIITVIFFISAYELTKYLYSVFQAKQLRISMLLLVLLDIYPHYYAWWNYFNYYNDDFYKQYIHQMFFTVTEIISTVLIVTLCSKEQPLNKWKVLVIVSISCVHIVVGGLDQFISQIVFNEGKLFQKMRNLGFLIPDLFHILLPVMEIRKYERSISFDKVEPPLFNKRDVIRFIFGTGLLCVLGKLILR